MSTQSKPVKGTGTNNIDMQKNYTNKYGVPEKSEDSGNTKPSVPFRGKK